MKLRLISSDIAVRQPKPHRSKKINMSPVMRPYIGGPRSGARGEYGDLLPIRPGTGIPAQCLCGEYLAHYGMIRTYSHRYQLHGTLCETCRRVEACDPHERHLCEWVHLDIAVRHRPEDAPRQGLVLLAHPAASGTVTDRIELQLDGAVVATATITCCPACRTAALGYVHATKTVKKQPDVTATSAPATVLVCCRAGRNIPTIGGRRSRLHGHNHPRR
jgi:hypothetical protein